MPATRIVSSVIRQLMGEYVSTRRGTSDVTDFRKNETAERKRSERSYKLRVCTTMSSHSSLILMIFIERSVYISLSRMRIRIAFLRILVQRYSENRRDYDSDFFDIIYSNFIYNLPLELSYRFVCFYSNFIDR